MNRYEIFRDCFPELKLGEEMLWRLLDADNCTFFECAENGELAGFAAVSGEELRLLCVAEKYRRKGKGTELMNAAEEHIRKRGGKSAVLGGESSELFIGAPVSRDDFEKRSFPFFENRGYALDDGCAEMELLLKDFSESAFKLAVPDNVTFGFEESGSERLKRAVAESVPEWERYFDGADVFCGFMGGEIASFCIVGEWEPSVVSDGILRTGSIGCVGTVPRYRRCGIGLKTVALAAQELKNQGFGKCFIHYTGVYDWYAKIGARTVLWELMGRKNLT